MNPEPFFQLDRVIHEKGRLALMSLMAATPHLSFKDMKVAVGMTDGNLTTHVKTLHQAGYVSVTKTFKGGRPLTTYALTESGKKAFGDYINLLEQIVQQNKGK